MAFWKRRATSPADRVAEHLALAPGERVLAAAQDTHTGATVVATLHDLAVLAPTGEELRRHRWLEVEGGSWENTTGTISVTWVDGSRGVQWTFGIDEARFAEVFRDRVEASRIIHAPIEATNATLGRAAIRKDLRTGELVPQLMFDRKVHRDDVEAREIGEETLAFLREQVGL